GLAGVWASVLLEAGGGPSVYAALPVTALRLPAFTVMTAAALLCSGVLPWRSWVSEVWTRRRLEAGTLAVVVLVPIGFYLLVRAYGMGAGEWPASQAKVTGAALGGGASLGSAGRGPGGADPPGVPGRGGAPREAPSVR